MADRNGTRRRADSLGVLMALLFLVVASVGLSGSIWWLLTGHWKWIAAGIVALIGLAMVLSTLPGRRRS
jgi:hypothetical protein